MNEAKARTNALILKLFMKNQLAELQAELDKKIEIGLLEEISGTELEKIPQDTHHFGIHINTNDQRHTNQQLIRNRIQYRKQDAGLCNWKQF